MRRGLLVAIGAGTVVLAALPIPGWVGAADSGPPWTIHLESWAIGLPVVLVVGLLVGWLGRRLQLPRLVWSHQTQGVLVAGLAVALVTGAAVVMHWSFATNPHSVDEMAQLFQARVFLAGRLAAPTPQHPEFFLFLHTWLTNGGWVSQFPPGHAALLAVGMVLEAAWLVNPILGGVALILVYVLARGLYGPRLALLAAVLWAMAAWVLFMSATYMNHASAVVFALSAWAVLLGVRKPGAPHYLFAGVFLSALLATRPLDAVAAAVPIGVWLMAQRRWTGTGWVAVGAVPFMVGLGYFNWRLFGNPLEFGYGVFHGEEQQLGFHVDAFGNQFTPMIALSNLAVAVRRLHVYLFEWPIPALLPVAVWALAAKKPSLGDGFLAVGLIAFPALYFFYWHSGFYPGPRFYYGLAPLLVIATARATLWAWKRARRFRWLGLRWDLALVGAGVATVLWGGSLSVAHAQAYRADLPSLKHHPARELAEAGVSQALVLVPESWGARTGVSLWALGARPGLVERAQRRLDTCDLHQLVHRARREEWSGHRLEEQLEDMIRAIKVPTPRVPNWPDPTLRLRARREIPVDCGRELQRDLRGFALYGPLGWRNDVELDSGIVFARDFFERDSLLVARYPDWQIWRFAPPADEPAGSPILTRLHVPQMGRAEGRGSDP